MSALFRYTLAAGATAVVIGTGFAAVGLNRYGDAGPAVPAAADTPAAPAAPAAAVGELLRNAAPMASAGARVAARPVPPAPTPTSPRPTVTPKRTSAAPSPARTTAQATTATRTGDTVVDQVLAHINAARTAHGLNPYTLDAKLSKAAALHTEQMIDGCGMQHQCPGESDLGDRISAQGVQWSSVGENIGFATSGPSDTEIARAANGLTDAMLAEVPPNDGHRKNLLSSGFDRIGLSVVRDAKGVTWMTQDFAD